MGVCARVRALTHICELCYAANKKQSSLRDVRACVRPGPHLRCQITVGVGQKKGEYLFQTEGNFSFS